MAEPDKSDWTKLYQSAMEYYRAAPWQWMENDYIFGVENPSNGQTGYCSVLGICQEEYGLGIFVGDNGYQGYLSLLSGERAPEDTVLQATYPTLSMLFVDREYLQKKEHAVIRSLNLRFRGRNAWPLFRSTLPGYAPWFLEKEDALFLSDAIQQALVVSNKVRLEKLNLLGKKSQNMVFTRYYRDGAWREEWRQPKPVNDNTASQKTPIEAETEAELKLLRKATGKPSGTWELDIFVLPAPVESESGRPYYPLCFLIVDRKMGLILDSRVIEPWLTLSQKQGELIAIFKKNKKLPQTIYVKSAAVKTIVEPLTGILEINLRMGAVPLLEEAQRGLFEYFGR